MVLAVRVQPPGRDPALHRYYKTGPLPWVRVAGGSLQAGPDGEEVARYVGGVWAVAGDGAPKCVIHGSTCTARFEGDGPDDSATHGPFEKVELVDGAVYAQPGRRLLARLAEQDQTRHSYADQRNWPKLVVENRSWGA